MILRRVEGSRFSEIEREWEGETVVLLGGGPSLTPDAFAEVEAAHKAGAVKVIAVNDSYLSAPYADGLYAADASWHLSHRAGVPKVKMGLTAEQVRERYASFAGWVCSIEIQHESIPDERVHILSRKTLPIAPTYNMTPTKELVAGMNSLHQAMNVAVMAGATRILLCGCDGGPVNGQTHHHGGHVLLNAHGNAQPKPTPDAFWPEMRKSFSQQENLLIEMDVEVVNCSLHSRVDSFPKVPLNDALCRTLTA